jgi:hypothetical protein
MVEVRAVTQGFAQDLAAMRSSVDTSLVGGFTQAGSTLDTSLSNALKKGTSGFSDLREAGISALAAIAAQATGCAGHQQRRFLGHHQPAFRRQRTAGAGHRRPGFAGAGLSGGRARAGGLVPTAAGSIANNAGNSGNRTMNVAINVNGTAGADAPQALARSSRQIASALRRVLVQN